MEKFEAMVAAQGGRWSEELPVAPSTPVISTQSGYVEKIDCQAIGSMIVALGGGRRKLGDAIDPDVGITVHVRIGDRVEKGQPLMELHRAGNSSHDHATNDYVSLLERSVAVSEEPVDTRPLVIRDQGPGAGGRERGVRGE